MMTTRAVGLFKFLMISLTVIAFTRGTAVTAATAPKVTVGGVIDKELRTPVRLALATDGDKETLYVTDPANRGVLKFDAKDNFKPIGKIAVNGIPQGIALTADGRLLVSLKESVAIYDAAGTEIRKLGSGVGQFLRAADIAVDDGGLIYVTDSTGACVKVFNNDGTYRSRFEVVKEDVLKDVLPFPTAIVFEKVSKQLAVVDALNGRVQFYNYNISVGTLARTIGTDNPDPTKSPIKLTHPQGVAFEYEVVNGVPTSVRRMYIADPMWQKIQAIDPSTGTSLSELIVPNMRHMLPSALIFDQTLNQNRLYVVNGLGGISYYEISDASLGSSSVTKATPAAGGNAIVLTSTSRMAAESVDDSAGSAVAPFVLSTVADGSTVTGELLDVSGLASGVATVVVNGQPVAVINGLFSTAVPLAAGANEITITATDAWGKSWKEVRTINRDAEATVVTVATPDVQSTGKVLLNLKGTIDRGADVTVAGVAAYLNELKWSSVVILTPGLNTIEIRATDLAGQTSGKKRTVFYKPAAPELSITLPTEDLVTGMKTLTIKGLVSAASDVTLTADINGVPKELTVNAGRFSLPVEFSQDGVYTVTLNATAGGDVSTVSRTIIYRTAQP